MALLELRSSHCPPVGALAFFVVQPCVFAVQPFAQSGLAPRLGFFWFEEVLMSRSVVRNLKPINGDVQSAAATPGLDVHDAAYHLAHDFPGGVPALAVRMGMSANTLQHKVSLTNTTHHLTLREAVALQEMSDDKRIVQAMCAALGGVFVDMGCDSDHTTMEQVMHMAKEFGDVLGAVNDAVSDGRVTGNEMQHCERQAAELIGALNGVLGTVRGMMPKGPVA